MHCRLKHLEELHLTRFAGYLKRLSLRQNTVSRLDPETFHKLTKLEELDLYDNRLKDVGGAFDESSKLTWASWFLFNGVWDADPCIL